MSDYTDYDSTVSEILDSLSTVDDKYVSVGNAASTLCDLNGVVDNIPNGAVIRNRNGDIIGYDYTYTNPQAPNTSLMEVDSNTDTGMYATGGGGETRGGGAGRGRRYTSNYVGTVNTNSQSNDKINGAGLVSGVISTAWAGVSALGKLGKKVASEAGEAIAQFTENFGRAYGNMCMDLADTSADVIRALFGVDAQGNTTMYLDEDTIGALALQLKHDGYFSEANSVDIQDIPTNKFYNDDFKSRVRLYAVIGPVTVTGTMITGKWVEFIVPYGVYFMWWTRWISGDERTFTWLISNQPATVTRILYKADGTIDETNNITLTLRTAKDGTQMYMGHNDGFISLAQYNALPKSTVPSNTLESSSWQSDVAYAILYGTIASDIAGITDQTGATIPVDAITGADPHAVAQNLITQYPGVMGTPVHVVVMDDSCNEVTINYYSVPTSYSTTNLSGSIPITANGQLNPSFNPSVSLDPEIDLSRYTEQIIDQLRGSGAGRDVARTTHDPASGLDLTDTLTSVLPSTGHGITPAWFPDDEVGPNVLWQVYNPTAAQLRAFGQWLWITGDVVTQLTRIVANPMDAVFGLHKVYVTPNRGSVSTIVCGNLDSEVSAFPVTNQYTTINCGSVWVTEFFGNIYDYSPYTEISAYLPFIGIVRLSVDDIMRGAVTIKYTVDVYTGSCIAEIEVLRDGVGGVLYQFNGNCSVEYPITAMSYNNAIMAAIGISSGVMGAIPQIAAGNLVGAGMSLSSSLIHSTLNQRENVQRSGSFSGNAGAMGAKKPYLIITRPQPEIASDYSEYEGYGANTTTEIGACTGFIKCRTVDLEISGAYKSELDEIESLLKSGVYT